MHAPVGGQQAGADDAPVQGGGIALHQRVRVAGHVGAMEAAEAEMDDAGHDIGRVVGGDTNRRSQAGERPAIVLDRAHFTAPKVRPRTSCRWLNQPNTRIGAIASVEAADSFAQNRPCGAENEAMNAGSGAASCADRLRLQNASFQHRMTDSSAVEAMPGSDQRQQHVQIACRTLAPSMRLASMMSFGVS